MTARSRQLVIMLVAMIMVGSASLLVPTVAGAATASAPDGATATGPDQVAVGEPMVITGTGWTAGSDGEGSVIAVKLDDGALSGTSPVTNPATGQEIANRTMFAAVQANDDGTFELTVPFPTSANATGTWQAGTEHGLRLLTGSLLTGDTPRSLELRFDVVGASSASQSATPEPGPKAGSVSAAGSLKTGDTIRTLQTGEFVVTDGTSSGALPAPSGTPDPVDPVTALVSGSAGGVTVAQSGSRLTITVPGLSAGDWVFPYVFGRQQVEGFDETAYEPFPTTWLQLNADRTVSVDLAAYDVDGSSAWRVSLQDRDQQLVGWAAVSAFSSASDDDDDVTTTSSSSSSDDLAETGGSRPAVLAVGVLLVLLGSLVLRRDLRRRSV